MSSVDGVKLISKAQKESKRLFKKTPGAQLARSIKGRLKPQVPVIPEIDFPEPEQEVAVIQEEATEARRRRKRRLLTGGRRSTILGGIAKALKKRLGA